MSVLGIIPARGGSKSLPGKNIIELGGKPLLSYSINAAMESGVIDQVVVTTDDQKIATIAEKYGADVVMRPKELATDSCHTFPAIEHAIKTLEDRGDSYDTIVLLQPTSPLRTAFNIRECLKLFHNSKSAESIISVIECEHHPYKSLTKSNGNVTALISEEYLESPRQSLPEAYRPNGALYVLSTNTLLDKRRFYVEPVLAYEMDIRSSIDIDNIEDLELCEFYLSNKPHSNLGEHL